MQLLMSISRSTLLHASMAYGDVACEVENQ